MPYARDQAGYIWETDAQGNPVRLAQQAQPQMPADPTYPTKGLQAQATLNNTQATTGHTAAEIPGAAAESRVKVATAPAAISSAQSEAALKAAQAQEAQRKIDDAVKQERLRGIGAVMSGDQVLNAVGQAKSHVGPWTTGITGELLSNLPNLPFTDNQAFDLGKELNTIKSNTAFNEYKSLKESLPEGSQGGVRLLQQELDMLARLKGDLSQTNNPQHLGATLDNIDQSQRRAAALSSGLDPFDPAVMQKLGINPVDPNSLAGKIYSSGGSQDPKQIASQALQKQYRDYTQMTKALPPRARQVGLDKLNANPNIQRLWGIVNASGGLTPPPRKPTAGKVIDFNDLP